MTNISIYSDLAGAPHIKVPGPVASGVSGEQGDLMGITAAGELVHATAAADGTGAESQSGPVACRGLLFPDHVTDLANDPEASAVRAVELYKGSNDTLAGEDRATVVNNGVILINTDEDWGFNCGEPVYLGVGQNTLTQTKPATAGQIVQAVGFAVDIDRVPAGEAVWIDIDTDYSTV